MSSRWMWVLVCALAGVAAAQTDSSESAAFCPLAIEPHPELVEPVDALQKKFFSVAREHSGYNLALRGEVDAAIKQAKATDLTQDAQLARVATAASTRNAGAFTLRIVDGGALLIAGRVVSADGKLLKSATVSVPRNGEKTSDALARGALKFFESLNGLAKPEPVAVAPTTTTGNTPTTAVGNSAGSPPPPPPLVTLAPSTPPNPGTPLRVAGVVLGVAGLGAVVSGVVLFATAPTVKVVNGNVLDTDAPKVAAVRAAQGAGAGALTAGVAVTLTGVLMFVLAPSESVTAAIAPTPDGAVFAVGGRW